MTVNSLISYLQEYDADAEVEIEFYDTETWENIDSTFDIGFQPAEEHPVLTIAAQFEVQRGLKI